jgi:hypothetical protein
MTGTLKFRVIGDREDVRTVIELFDPLLDITEDWRIYPQRTGENVMAYLEARPRVPEGTEGPAAGNTAEK